MCDAEAVPNECQDAIVWKFPRPECRMDDSDPIVSVLPIHLSNSLAPNVHIHQFPLLNRPLQVPPSAALSGKRIRARLKPNTRRLEIHVPADTRAEVWNAEKSKELGAGRLEDDKEKNQDVGKVKLKEGEEPRLSEIRLRSEDIPHTGAYMLGIVRDGKSFANAMAHPRLKYFCLRTSTSTPD